MADRASASQARVSDTKKRRLAALEKSIQKRQPLPSPAATPSGRDSVPAQAPSQRTHAKPEQRQAPGAAERPATNAAPRPAPSKPVAPARELADTGAADAPPYDGLSSDVREGALAHLRQGIGLQRSGAARRPGRAIDGLLEELLGTRMGAAEARGAVGLKMQDKTLMLDNPVAARPRSAEAAAAQRRRRLRQRPASARTLRALGLVKLPEAERRFELAEAVHALWQRYAARALAEPGAAQTLRTLGCPAPPADARLAERVAALELTGARIVVARCRDARWAGAEGVVVRDAPAALHMLTPAGRLAFVGKRGSEFWVALGGGTVAALDGSVLARAR